MSQQGNNISVEQDGDGVVVTIHEVAPDGVARAQIRLSPDDADGIAEQLINTSGVVRYGIGGATEAEPSPEGQAVESTDPEVTP